MKIFYSARANAFYRDDFHGTRLISIPDPDWKPPMIKVPDPAWSTPVVKGPMPGWIRPLVEVPNPEWKEGAVDVPAAVLVPDVNAVAPTVDIPDLEAVHPLIDTPDPSAVAPLIEVPNPNCLLPPEDELVDVSEDDHRAIEATIATSLSVLTSDEQGRPITIPAPGQTAEQMLAGALSQRDRLITLATTRIAPLQDAVDLGDATEGDVANLKKWKQYRVAVNRVPDQSGFPHDIVWPLEPS